MLKSKRTIIIVIIAAVIGLLWFLLRSTNAPTDTVVIQPKKGDFIISVTTTGELQAKNSIDITGPTSARKAGLWQLKITQLIPEGTIVQKGQFVAELDKSELMSKIKEVEINLQKLQSQFTQAKLDCTLTLAQSRDELINLRYALEQRKLEKAESVYESPSTQRQVEIEYEKAERSLKQSTSNYETKVKQAEAKMREATADLSKEESKFEDFLALLSEFTISAPENGMVIYKREWDGAKRIVGSSISPFDPSVATLPDLSVMESKTFVNEVDIQKIKPGLTVNIGLDADPDKKLTGVVAEVANIGEQRPNSDAKVFEVKILINERDSTLRPAMTTSNEIIVAKIPDVLFIPLEAVRTVNDKSIVFKKQGTATVMQEVELGEFNDNYVIVRKGLTQEDNIYLSAPETENELTLIPLEPAS